MVARNANVAKLPGGYLFPEIGRRTKLVQEKFPEAKIISLGKGNTTEPLSGTICDSLVQAAAGLSNLKGYSGYGDEVGDWPLRECIAAQYYQGQIKPEEVLISDGAKCDIGRLQMLFGPTIPVAVQDPSYPVYVDGSVIVGASRNFDSATHQFGGLTYLECRPENRFFPNLDKIQRGSLIYFCSPNNPTGAVATKEELQLLVDCALERQCIIIYDAAYALYIRDPKLPRSIFEIPGARETAIEVNSLSKSAGFTGVRLGWSVVPLELKYDNGLSVNSDWSRLVATVFNGASNIVQKGALTVLSPAGFDEMRSMVAFYLENARLIKAGLTKLGIESYGGENAPYIWAHFPGRKSWEVFEEILNKAFVVTTPGSGFGPGGEGFLRFSAYGHRKDIEEAVGRLQKLLS